MVLLMALGFLISANFSLWACAIEKAFGLNFEVFFRMTPLFSMNFLIIWWSHFNYLAMKHVHLSVNNNFVICLVSFWLNWTTFVILKIVANFNGSLNFLWKCQYYLNNWNINVSVIIKIEKIQIEHL